jgi:hypothetical protein
VNFASPPAIQNISGLSQGRAGALRGLWRCDLVIDATSNLGAIAMPMSAQLPFQTPTSDGRKQINWAWNDVLKVSGKIVVVAAAALFVVLLVAASVTLPKSTLDPTISGEFWIGP